MSTPTKLTHSMTTSFNDSINNLSLTSCWYIPTPKCFGSILTNSARGSLSRRAIETVCEQQINKNSAENESAAMLRTGAHEVHIHFRELLLRHIAAGVNRGAVLADDAIFDRILVQDAIPEKVSNPALSLTASGAVSDSNQLAP